MEIKVSNEKLAAEKKSTDIKSSIEDLLQTVSKLRETTEEMQNMLLDITLKLSDIIN